MLWLGATRSCEMWRIKFKRKKLLFEFLRRKILRIQKLSDVFTVVYAKLGKCVLIDQLCVLLIFVLNG